MTRNNPSIIASGALEAALPEINSELGKMQQNVVVAAFNLLREGKLSPESAKDLWHQMYSMAELNRRLNTRSTLDAAQAEKQMKALTEQKD